jgi:hypothetical protein
MELRRKRNTVSAIIRFVRPMFYENLSLQKKLEARRKSRVPLFWFFATVVVVHLLDYSVPDTSRWFDFTVGKIVGACSYVIWLIYNLDTERMERRLKYSQQALDEMLYRWIANGGAEFRFWQLRDQVDVGTGDIDIDGDIYSRWRVESEGDLVDSIKGEPVGHGLWRPEF